MTLDDFLCGGLGCGHLTVLAARTSVGKTTFACNVCANICRRGGAVYFASLEQDVSELTERILATLAEVSGRRIRSGDLNTEHVDRLTQAAAIGQNWKWITD